RPGGLRGADAGDGPELGGVRRAGELNVEPPDGQSAEVLEAVDDDEPSLAEDGNAIGDAVHLRERVGRQEDAAALGAHLAEQLVEVPLHERVKPGDRLVEDQ